ENVSQKPVRHHFMTCSCHLFFLCMYRRHLKAPFFPYTTLFRSETRLYKVLTRLTTASLIRVNHLTAVFLIEITLSLILLYKFKRSEEHTSELQSRFELVWRLLFEK